MIPTPTCQLRRDVYTAGSSLVVRGTCLKCGVVKTVESNALIDQWWVEHLKQN